MRAMDRGIYHWIDRQTGIRERERKSDKEMKRDGESAMEKGSGREQERDGVRERLEREKAKERD